MFNTQSILQLISLQQWLIVLYIEGHIDDHGQLEQKQNKLLSESEVVNRARQVNLAAAKNAVTTKRKSAIGSSHASDHGNTIII